MTMLGTHGDAYVFPGDICEKAMTAIAMVQTEDGFVLAADGRVRLDDDSRLTASPEMLAQETDQQQKIFPIVRAGEAFAYAVTGNVRDPFGFDLLVAIEVQNAALSQRKFEDFRSYLRILGGKVNRAINEAVTERTLEALPKFNRMETIPGWRIATLYACGYFNNTPYLGEIDFHHSRRDSQFDVKFHPPFSTIVSGSQIVRRHMYGDDVRAARDPRFAKFVHDLGKNVSLEDAQQFARGYIEACSSALGLEVDEPICKGIGGHIHIATISKEKGFTWVIEPLRKEIP